MQIIENLIEEYQFKIDNIDGLLLEKGNGSENAIKRHERLTTKKAEYEAFVLSLESLKKEMKSVIVSTMSKMVVRGCFRGTETKVGRNYKVATGTLEEMLDIDYEEEVGH
jgi:ribonuclease HI